MHQLDEYEREFMSDGTPVLYRERLSYPTWYRYLVMIIVLLTLIGAGVMAVMLREWLLALPVAMTPIWALLLLMMATLRISVTNKAVHIQYGVFADDPARQDRALRPGHFQLPCALRQQHLLLRHRRCVVLQHAGKQRASVAHPLPYR